MSSVLKKEDIPVVMQAPGTFMRASRILANMTAVYHEFPKGTDFTPLTLPAVSLKS